MNKIIKLLTLGFSASLLAACATTNFPQMSKATGLPVETLSQYCQGIRCHYDDLKENVQATANDQNVALLLFGGETRTMQFDWVSGTFPDKVTMTVFHTTLYGSWTFIRYAEVYVEKEMIAKIEGHVDRVVGKYNDVAQDHENIESVRGVISLQEAEKIASADPSTITIRFYSDSGYSDIKPPRPHKLINVIELAKAYIASKPS